MRSPPNSNPPAVFDAPRGTGPYGITTTPEGRVFFASLAGNYLGRIEIETGTTTVLEPPVPRQGARRVWSDSRGGLWITGWNSGDLFRYDRTIVGSAGICRATGRNPTLSTSMTPMPCG